MTWRYSARKGFITRKGGAKRKETIEKEVARLRRDGYKVNIYEVK